MSSLLPLHGELIGMISWIAHSKLTVWAHLMSSLWANWASSKWAHREFHVSSQWAQILCWVRSSSWSLFRQLRQIPISIIWYSFFSKMTLTVVSDVSCHASSRQLPIQVHPVISLSLFHILNRILWSLAVLYQGRPLPAMFLSIPVMSKCFSKILSMIVRNYYENAEYYPCFKFTSKVICIDHAPNQWRTCMMQGKSWRHCYGGLTETSWSPCKW